MEKLGLLPTCCQGPRPDLCCHGSSEINPENVPLLSIMLWNIWREFHCSSRFGMHKSLWNLEIPTDSCKLNRGVARKCSAKTLLWPLLNKTCSYFQLQLIPRKEPQHIPCKPVEPEKGCYMLICSNGPSHQGKTQIVLTCLLIRIHFCYQ